MSANILNYKKCKNCAIDNGLDYCPKCDSKVLRSVNCGGLQVQKKV